MLLVRSYRTFAPLPVHETKLQAIGGVFLWHYPHGHPHWALPSKFDHLGARTFLNRGFIVEIQQISIAITSPAFRFHNALKGENLPVGL